MEAPLDVWMIGISDVYWVFFTSADKKLDIYLNSESYGEQKEKVAYFINSNGDCVSIRDLDYNDNFGDEMLEAFEELKMN